MYDIYCTFENQSRKHKWGRMEEEWRILIKFLNVKYELIFD